MSEFFSPGTLVGRYRLERLLGQGGMGQVWAATDSKTPGVRALKFLNDPMHSRPDRRRRFRREARLAKAVDHPNVVQIHDFFELEDGTPVMVMDLLEGETFGTKLRREGALPLRDVVDILLPVISAVGTAHSIGIIHRDLKPDNVFLLGPSGASTGVCVLDFGIAKLRLTNESNDGDGLTDTGALLGTPSYTSPEQGFGEKNVDHRTDLWSLGVMIYEGVSGTRPIEGDNPRQILRRLMSEAIVPLEQIVPELPTEVASLVGRLLARDTASRPEDLREVAQVLSRYGTVRTPAFGAAVGERAPPLDSSPVSAQSSPYAVVRAPDLPDFEAKTLEGAPPTFPDGIASRSSLVESDPSVRGMRGGRVAVIAAVLLVIAGVTGYGLLSSSLRGKRTSVSPAPIPQALNVVPSPPEDVRLSATTMRHSPPVPTVTAAPTPMPTPPTPNTRKSSPKGAASTSASTPKAAPATKPIEEATSARAAPARSRTDGGIWLKVPF